MTKPRGLAELLLLVKQEKNYVLAPMAVVLVLLAVLLLFFARDKVAPFIYSRF